MRYVRRDEAGNVIGHFANEQPYAKEALADDHPELIAFTEARESRRREARGFVWLLSEVEALTARVAALEARLK